MTVSPTATLARQSEVLSMMKADAVRSHMTTLSKTLHCRAQQRNATNEAGMSCMQARETPNGIFYVSGGC